MQTTVVQIAVDDAHAVSGLLQVPRQARACYVMAHGAGAGMTHPFMTAVADGLWDRHVATFRYQFPYMERRSKRPDPPALAHATVRAAVAEANRLVPSLPLIAGGKSFRGRMTSQAQADRPLPHVRGLAFLGFPLHPAKQPSDVRAEHLSEIQVPMLFLQGTRDALADMPRLASVISRLGNKATLVKISEADHSFHVPARSGRTDAQALAEILDPRAAASLPMTEQPLRRLGQAAMPNAEGPFSKWPFGFLKRQGGDKPSFSLTVQHIRRPHPVGERRGPRR